jgi:hypothetical protein
MEMDKHTERTIEMVHKLLKDKNEFDTWYSMPYSSSDDDRVDVHIEYKVKKVSLWKNNDPVVCLFDGTIYIQPIKVSLGVDDMWEHGFRQDDVYERIWDELGEDLVREVESILTHVCIDYDFDFTILNS